MWRSRQLSLPLARMSVGKTLISAPPATCSDRMQSSVCLATTPSNEREGRPARVRTMSPSAASYPSQTKPGATPCPIEVLREARACLSIPIVAIGGITPENGAALLCEGAGLLAIVNGVFAHPDPCATAQAYTLLFRDPENDDEI